MMAPRLFRTTPFRLTLLFLALFAGAAAAFLLYIYAATAGDATAAADAKIEAEVQSLQTAYQQNGFMGLNQAVIDRASGDNAMLYLVMDSRGRPVSGTIGASPVRRVVGDRTWVTFDVAQTDPDGRKRRRPARGLQTRLAGGESLFVGVDVGESEAFVLRILHAMWGAGAVVLLLGLAGGLLVSRNVSRNMAGLTSTIEAARQGDLAVRAQVRGTGDEYDELALGLNHMLERLERSVAGLRHAGDAIAHDLRSPLTRLRARLEAGLIETESGQIDPRVALRRAIEDSDGVLRTFAAVLAIARLEASVDPPGAQSFDPAVLAGDVAELYEPLCEEKGLMFAVDFERGLELHGNREFLAQALANLLDNAVKYTPHGGSVRLTVSRLCSGEIECAVADTGPGVPPADRERVVQRFVRLEHSRNAPGVGLGLSLAAAVAAVHRGRLILSEAHLQGPGGAVGLRAALVLPERP
jgi:signal transduction histidine kinase